MSRKDRSFTFDPQAADFDRRAGIPAGAAGDVATAVEELAAGRGVLLDVGAGTGEIGSILARRLPYVGLDVSGPMLAVYRRKLGAGMGAVLVLADAGKRWPIADAAVGTLFLSRAAHLLSPTHLVAEALRVTCPEGATLILGRVRREPGSLRAEMRRQMHRLLADHGVEGRGGERSRRRLTSAFEERGARVSPPREVASWPVVERAAESLEAWREKPGLAGRALEPEIRRDVLRRLERWARDAFGSLEVTHRGCERYELTVIDLPGGATRLVS